MHPGRGWALQIQLLRQKKKKKNPAMTLVYEGNLRIGATAKNETKEASAAWVLSV